MPLLGRRKSARPTDGSMTLREHLYELRHRLFLAVLAVFLGSVVGFIWYSVGIPSIHLRSLGDILTAPYCSVPAPPRVEFDGIPCGLFATGPFSALHIRLSSAIMAGFLLTCPVWLYQLWAFVGPALYSKERKFALTFTGVAAALFAGGMVLAYLVIPEGLKVLLGFGGDVVVAGLDPERYYSFLMGMMVIFGVSLELPLLLVMLNFAGVLKGAQLAKARRYAFFGLVVFSALVVPGNDPVSMSVLALTLCLLYEAAIQVSKAHDKRKAKLAERSLSALPDDAASPLETGTPDSGLGTPGGIEAPEALDAPVPVAAGPATPTTGTADGGTAGSGGGTVASRWSDAGDAT